MKFFIHYTIDRSAYYITTRSPKHRPTCFVSVNKIAGLHTKEMEEACGFGPSFIEIKKLNGEIYCRKVWAFWCWDMKTDHKEVIANMKDDTIADMVADYSLASRWNLDFRNILDKICDWLMSILQYLKEGIDAAVTNDGEDIEIFDDPSKKKILP